MKMTMFHGTSKLRGDKILNDRCLKASEINRVYGDNPLFPTTDHQVYLTPYLAKAFHYGQQAATGPDKDDSLYIFKMKLNRNELLPDYDEIEFAVNPFLREGHKIDLEKLTLDQSLEKGDSAAYPKDICASDVAISYALFKIKGENNQKELIDYFVHRRHEQSAEVRNSIQEMGKKLDWIQM